MTTPNRSSFLFSLAVLCWSVLAMALVATAENTTEVCALQCRNGGSCKFGRADFGFASEFQDDLDNMIPFGEQVHNNNMYCSCPAGYTGIECEIVLTICENGQHFCFNGGECKRAQSDEGTIYYHCECDAARSDLSQAYAGSFCQHAATIFCAVDEDGSKSASHTFCTNGGLCKQMIEHDEEHQGCECPGQWDGEHCEFKNPDKKQPTPHSKRAAMSFIGIVAGMVGVAFISWLFLLVLTRRKRKTQDDENDVELRKDPYGIEEEELTEDSPIEEDKETKRYAESKARGEIV